MSDEFSLSSLITDHSWLSSEQKVQVSDTTGAEQSDEAGNITKNNDQQFARKDV